MLANSSKCKQIQANSNIENCQQIQANTGKYQQVHASTSRSEIQAATSEYLDYKRITHTASNWKPLQAKLQAKRNTSTYKLPLVNASNTGNPAFY